MTGDTSSAAKAARLAAALRANLRRRKTPAPGAAKAPHADGGADDGDRLYRTGRGDPDDA